MKRVAPILLAGALSISACSPDGTAPTAPELRAPAYNQSVTGDRIIVSFNGSSSAASIAANAASLGGTLEWYHAGAGVGVVSGMSEAAAAGLEGANLVAIDEAIQLSPVQMEVSDAAADAAITPASQANPALAAFYPRQWHMRSIFANNAWAAGKTGSSSVTVAILDTGIDATYVDLDLLVNVADGASFIPSEPTTQDFHYHGTHVASTVASESNVIAGVTSRTTLLPVKVLSAAGSGNTSITFQGILYAVDEGADVINMSLGGYFVKRGGDGETGAGRLMQLINKVMSYAHRNGVVVVVAAGNDGVDLSHTGNAVGIPSLQATYCEFPNVICVSALGPTASGSVNGPFVNVDAFAAYSNFGRSAITVAAPGGNQRPVWGACSRASLLIPVCQSGTFVVGLSGTSMAAPHVSGLAALLVAELGANNPSQVRAALVGSADDLGQPGIDPFYGHGRINVKNALGL